LKKARVGIGESDSYTIPEYTTWQCTDSTVYVHEHEAVTYIIPKKGTKEITRETHKKTKKLIDLHGRHTGKVQGDVTCMNARDIQGHP